jgi:predicted dehydrogenase
LHEPLRVAVLGCGDISRRYIEALSAAPGVRLTACASRTLSSAQSRAPLGCEAVAAEQLFARTDIDLLVNLTPPLAHAETTARALEAGFHVYSEKPLAATLAEADQLIALSRARGLTLACAPATFLGPAQQTARRLIDAGELGQVLGASATMVYPGPDRWHHNPAALFGPAAGPVFDMGVYDVTALVGLFGPVARVSAAGGRARSQRNVGTGPRAGQAFAVEVPTHAAALLSFCSGAVATLTLSFDGVGTSGPGLEIYGTASTLSLPRSGAFDGAIQRSSRFQVWEELETDVGWSDPLWAIGVLETAEAIREGRPPRAGSDLARHVLEVLMAILASIESGETHAIYITSERPEPLRPADYDRIAAASTPSPETQP